MGDLKDRADSLISRINQIWKTLSNQKESFGGLMSELKTVADVAERIDAENEKLVEENKKLQGELAGMKK